MELLKQYPCNFTDEQVQNAVKEILAKEFEGNNNVEVYKKCFNLIDLTSLNSTDNNPHIVKMVEKVNKFPIDFPDMPHVAAMCLYPPFIAVAKSTLTIPMNLAAVSAVFPSSQSFIEVKIAETALTVSDGADEIDIVISIGKFLNEEYEVVAEEIQELKAACGKAHLKVILETGALKTAENIYKASVLAMAAGGDFIKTSTGKMEPAATLEATYVMCQAIKDYYAKTGEMIGYKPAGGIVTTEDAVQHYTIVKSVLGEEWLNNTKFRLGASRLSNNLLTSIYNKEVKYF